MIPLMTGYFIVSIVLINMIDTIRFLLFFFTFIYLPGITYQQIFLKKRKDTDGFLASQVLIIVTGAVLFFYFSLLVRALSLPYELSLYSLAAILGFVFIKYNLSLISLPLSKNATKTDLLTLFIIIISAYSLVFFHLGSIVNYQIARITAASDSLWHLSIINELSKRFPPQHPGYAGELIKNYHYFYDLLIASAQRLSGIDVFVLYYRFFPLVSSLLLIGIIVAYLRKTITHNFLLVILGLILIIFSGNLSYVLPFISDQYDFYFKSNIFMSDQPFDQGHNAFNLFAFAVFFLIIYLLQTVNQKNEKHSYILLSLLTGLLIGMKIYAAVVVLGALAAVNLYHLMKRDFRFFRLLPLILPAILYFLLISSPSGGTHLVWRPFWVLDRMMADSDRLYIKDFLLKLDYYKSNNLYLRLVLTRIQQLLIYVVGNFNLRILGFLGAFFTLYNYKKITPHKVFIISAFTIAFLFPLFFIQSKNPYDIIQFNHYVLLIGGLLTLQVIVWFSKNTQLGQKTITQIVILIIISAVTLPSTLLLLWGRTKSNYDYFDTKEVEALLYLKENTPQDSVILTDPGEIKLDLMYVPAISARSVFLGGRGSVVLTGISVADRMTAYETYFSRLQCTDLSQLIDKYNISYIYLSNEGLAYEPLFENSIYNKIYSNDNVVIYAR